MQHAEMQESQYDNVGSMSDCSYMKPLPEHLNNIYVESSIMYKRSYSFKNENYLIDLHNDWTEIENKNEWKIYPTRIPRRLQYFKGSFEEPSLDDYYELETNEPKYIDKYLFEDIPKTLERAEVETSTKKLDIKLENISEDDDEDDDSTYDCCSLWSIDESFCSCANTRVSKENSICSTTKPFDEEQKEEQKIIPEQDLKETSSSTENSSCQSEIASPAFEVISLANPKKDFYLELENSCPNLEEKTHVSIKSVFE